MWPDNNGSESLRITLDKYVDLHSQQVPVNAIGLKQAEYKELLLSSMIAAMVNASRKLSKKKYIIDKITPYLDTSASVVEQIRTRFPRGKIIYLTRDGRDVLTSGTFDWLKKDAEGTDRYRYFIRKDKDFILQRFFDDEQIHLWSRYWTEPYQAISSSKHAFLLIKYERMLDSYVKVLASVLEYCEIEVTPAQLNRCEQLSNFSIMSGGRARGENSVAEKQRKGVAGDWSTYFTRRDGLLFQQLAGDQLQSLGYITGPEWVDTLPESLSLEPLV